MKFTRTLFILLTVSLTLCSKLKTTANEYKMTVLGDNGEYVKWKIDYDLAQPLPNVLDKTNAILAGEYNSNLEALTCAFTPAGGQTTDMTSAEATQTIGMKNFNDVINTANFKTLAAAADNIVFLGDIVYPESKKLYVEVNGKMVTAQPEQWNKRLDCAWIMFIKQIVTLSLHNGKNLNNKVDILTGNHSYDVSFDEEKRINEAKMQKAVDAGKYYTMKKNAAGVEELSEIVAPTPLQTYTYVRKMTVTIGTRKINIVDFNSSAIVGLNDVKETYETCVFTKNYQNRPTHEQALTYFKTVANVVLSLEDNAWNVLRAHHPPVNFEDGDADFYFMKIAGLTLIKIFEQKKVRFFFGSHIHAQAVMALPYKDGILRQRQDEVGLADGVYCNSKNLEAANNELLTNTPCTVDTFSVDVAKENIMLVFINGNSGRSFDPPSTGKKSSHGNIVWVRRNRLKDQRDAFGFSNVVFKQNEVKVDFYQLADKEQAGYETVRVATFNVAESVAKPKSKRLRKK